ncbi:MAG: corrinoid protein [Verrucomicrobia bacterium]|nr:corrinoid protein [Verrucomicrobiota bacterium]MCF7708559.1 corrinoid protein [Verrucomicrobiota bacterium]
MENLEELYNAILEGRMDAAQNITENALQKDINPQLLIDDHMIPAMDEAGRRFEAGEYFIPEMMLAARAMKAALNLIRPVLLREGAQYVGTVVIGTVKGDLHDIGKNLVAAMLEGSGFEVKDLGVDVAPEKFVDTVKETGAGIIAMSALLTTTMPSMKLTVDVLKQDGLRDKVKVMVGGAPLSPRYAEEFGADGYSENAAAAVNLARKLVTA